MRTARGEEERISYDRASIAISGYNRAVRQARGKWERRIQPKAPSGRAIEHKHSMGKAWHQLLEASRSFCAGGDGGDGDGVV